MWPLLWAGMRTYAPYITFPVALVVGAVGYHLEGMARGPAEVEGPEKSVLEQRDERRLEEQAGQDGTHVPSLKDRLEFRPRAALDRNRPHQT